MIRSASRSSRAGDGASPDGSNETADVAVIVCAYTDERWDDIIEALTSIAAQEPRVTEKVLVIDHNDELLAKARERLAGQDLVIVANMHEKGLSGARNSGIAASTASIVAFLDDDAVADPGWIANALFHYEDANVIGVGGGVRPIWQTVRPRWWPEEFDWVVGCSYKGLPKSGNPMRNPIGANMSVRRSAFTAVGGFSPAIGRVGKRPAGCEETELFIRVHRHSPGKVVIHAPESSVGHKVPGDRASYSYFRARCYAEGLSKAVVSKLVGAEAGLSSERAYTAKTLPLGVLKGIRQGFTGKPAGFVRAGAIVVGLAITVAGYARGRFCEKTHEESVIAPLE